MSESKLKKKGRGRPPLPKGKKLSQKFLIGMSISEKKLVEKAAKYAGMSRSRFISLAAVEKADDFI